MLKTTMQGKDNKWIMRIFYTRKKCTFFNYLPEVNDQINLFAWMPNSKP